MSPPFPLSPAPAWFTYARWKDSDTKRNGVFTVGEAVSIRLNASGANAYEVRDYFGTVVDSGAVSGTTLNLGSSWQPGWYRVYFTGPNTDAVFGPAYASTNFTVVRSSGNMVPLPAGDHIGHNYGDPLDTGYDPIMRAGFGIAPGRLELPQLVEPTFSGNNYVTPAVDSWLDKVGKQATFARDWWLTSGYQDQARPRYTWVAFADGNGAVDRLILPGSGGDYLHCYLKDDSRDGSQVFVALAAGSVSGRKVTVSYPNAGTVVETYDNLADGAAAETAINAGSAYIHVIDWGSAGTTLAATAIGKSIRTMVVGAVSYLSTLGVTRFEGPYNEPTLTGKLGREAVWMMKLFQLYVHAGNANAKAIGPCPVAIDYSGWKSFLDLGGGEFCDELSFHDYNSMTNGNLALGRYTIERFVHLLEAYGLSSKTLWQTEANTTFTSVYGVYHPRRARFNLLHTLLWEQYGVPRERNGPWYDTNHGFYSYPAWLEMTDASLNPQCAMLRVLAEETWGQTHHHRLRFGTIGDKFVLGSMYRGADGAQTVVLISTTHMDGATVTLTVTGASSLTVVDAFGNTSTVSVTAGRAAIPLDDIPTYVRLPVGVNATVYQVNDWGSAQPPSISSKAVDMKVGATFTMVPIDDALNTNYGLGRGMYFSSGALPENATMMWGSSVNVDRVIVVCGQAWQNAATLVQFSVQTTTDGVNFTTRQTVTKTAPSSFLFGDDGKTTGCSRETYWDEQWAFDVPLGATYSCTGIRVVATSASYGGEPDADCVTAGGQGAATPHLVLQEIFVPSASLADTPVATPKTASFEAGVNGNTITTGAGEAALTAWNTVNSTPTYSNAQAGRGNLSMRIVSGTSPWVAWTLANLTDHYGRFLFRYDSPAGHPRVMYVFDNTPALAATIQLDVDDNRPVISDTTNGSSYEGVTNCDPGRWYRFEYRIVHSATVGQMWLRVYDDATGELRETLVSPATWNTKANGAEARFGALAGGTDTYWMDEIAAAADAFLGPIAPTIQATTGELVGAVMI